MLSGNQQLGSISAVLSSPVLIPPRAHFPNRGWNSSLPTVSSYMYNHAATIVKTEISLDLKIETWAQLLEAW